MRKDKIVKDKRVQRKKVQFQLRIFDQIKDFIQLSDDLRLEVTARRLAYPIHLHSPLR